MRIVILGGGPAGLFFAVLMKRLDPSHAVTVFERDGPHDTFGWGIVFSDQAFEYLRESDPASCAAITAACQQWDNVDVVHRGQRITIRGNRFSGIARIRFLEVLHRRCGELGVELVFNTPVADLSQLPPHDLLVGADGANSLVRRTHGAVFAPAIEQGRNKYIWLGTPKLFHGLTLTFVEDTTGVYAAHAYKFDDRTSTFIVECSEETWQRAGFEGMSQGETCDRLAHVFRGHLNGAPLLSNDYVKWLNFLLVRNARWYGDGVVLLGDALHTAHFSIGSGTKLALEDAIALSGAFTADPDPAGALPLFEQARRPRVEQYQQAALDSLLWFEEVDRYMALEPLPFAMAAMTRSGRIDYQKLRQRDAAFVAAYERWKEAHGVLEPEERDPRA